MYKYITPCYMKVDPTSQCYYEALEGIENACSWIVMALKKTGYSLLLNKNCTGKPAYTTVFQVLNEL